MTPSWYVNVSCHNAVCSPHQVHHIAEFALLKTKVSGNAVMNYLQHCYKCLSRHPEVGDVAIRHKVQLFMQVMQAWKTLQMTK